MTWPFGLLRRNAYGVIYADPAWQYSGYASEGVPQTSKDQHYETMHVDEMARLPVAQLAKADCALFMWGIASHLPQALQLGAAWGFTYSSKAFCWAKQNKHAEANHAKRMLIDGDNGGPKISDNKNWFIGMGHGSRRNTEDCWLFTRGNPKRLDRGVRELIVSPIREHSRKPDETYDRIERLFSGPYCELFSRQSRGGWSSWGNETGKFG